MAENRGLLRQRNFRLLYTGQCISLLGDGMINVALPFAVLYVGGSASEVGLVFAARMAALVACLLVGGVVADRVSRRAVMVVADLVRMLAQGLAAGLLIAGVADVWSLALLAAVTGGATGFFNPAATSLLPEVVDAGQLQEANGLRATAQAAGEIAGPLIAAGLVVVADPGWALAIDGATFGLSALFLARLSLTRRPAGEPASFLADLREGWQTFTAQTWLWSIVLWATFTNVLWGAWMALGPVVADRDLGGAGAWGTTLAAMGAGGLVGGLLAIRARPSRPLVVTTLGWTLFAAPLALLAAGAGVVALAFGALIAGAGLMLAESVWQSTVQRNVPADSLSRVSAFDWFGSLAFKPLGLAIWGPVAAAIGLSTALWLAFGLMTVGTLLMLSVRDVRELRGHAATAA